MDKRMGITTMLLLSLTFGAVGALNLIEVGGTRPVRVSSLPDDIQAPYRQHEDVQAPYQSDDVQAPFQSDDIQAPVRDA